MPAAPCFFVLKQQAKEKRRNLRCGVESISETAAC
jgi:hypothetical protein